MTDLVCERCGGRDFSPMVAAVMIYAPSLPHGFYFIEPDLDSAEYRLCNGACPSAALFLRRAMDSHPMTRDTRDWTNAGIIFVVPGAWWMLERKSVEKEIARA